MKRILLFAAIVFSFAACGPKDNEAIKKEIGEAEAQIEKLEAHIADLKKQLPAEKANELDAISITVLHLVPQHFEHHFESTGTVEAVEAAVISPQMNGQIKTIHVKEGQKVAQGTLLVSLNSSVLSNNKKELETALEFAKVMYKKQQELWDKKIGSEVQYLQAKNNKEAMERKLESLNSQLALTQVKAPFSGIVDMIYSKEGEMAAPGSPLINFVNLSSVFVNADVAESYMTKVHKGDSVKVSFPAAGGKEVHTVVSRISNVINPNNRTFEVQVKINNADELIKPNSLATMVMSDFVTNQALLVSSEYVKSDINGEYVYVVDQKDGKPIAAKRYVTTGVSDETRTMILKGLAAGDKVIANGYNQVKQGTPVAVK